MSEGDAPADDASKQVIRSRGAPSLGTVTVSPTKSEDQKYETMSQIMEIGERDPVLAEVMKRELLVQQVLARIAITGEQIKQAHERLDNDVELGRRAGATWAMIGEALGITPQSAHRRFSAEAKAKHNESQNRRRAEQKDESEEG